MHLIVPPCPKTAPTLTQKPHKHPRTLNPAKQHKLTKIFTQKPILKINKNTKTNTKKSTASDVLKLLDALNLKIPNDMYIDFIKECTFNKDLKMGTEVYDHVKNNSSDLDLDLDLCNWVLIMYLTCGCLEGAYKMFVEMPRRGFYTWVVMMVGFFEAGLYREGLEVFAGMVEGRASMAGLPSWVWVCTLKCCVVDLEVGRQVHVGLVKLGYVVDGVVSGGLVDMYGKLGCLESAKGVLDQVMDQDTVLWTSKIVNECRKGNFVGVIKDFIEMEMVGVERNGYTFSSVLRACGRLKDDGVCGRQVHSGVVKLGLESEIYVQCALIDMYGKCGMLDDARKVFEITRDEKNVACWNAMVSSYTQHGLIIEAFKILHEMKEAKMEPQVSITSKVKVACGSDNNVPVGVSQIT